jgi:hypothetical protein
MPQQILHRPDIRAALQQMRRETVPNVCGVARLFTFARAHAAFIARCKFSGNT